MSRDEDKIEKAHRLLADGALKVTRREGDLIEAFVVGDHGEYVLGYSEGRHGWYCECPAFGGRCSHLHALRLVTDLAPVPPLPRRPT